MQKVIFFSLAPGRLRIAIRIRASFHNLCYTRSEAPLHFFQHRRPTAILHHVVQESRNRNILVAAELQSQRSHAHQVGKIRRGRRLPHLALMFFRRKKERLQKPRSKLDRVSLLSAHFYLSCFSPRRASKYARMNGCRSPSSTRSTSPTSVFVR